MSKNFTLNVYMCPSFDYRNDTEFKSVTIIPIWQKGKQKSREL